MQERMMMVSQPAKPSQPNKHNKQPWGDGWKRTDGQTDGPTNTTLQSRMGREEEEEDEEESGGGGGGT